jgi:hypothetical protein
MEKKDMGVYVPARALNPEVPESLECVLARLLARNPEQRYPSASALIVDLERAQLAAAVPSFIDLDLALRDPVVRERLSATAQPTSVDVHVAAPAPAADKVPGETGYWFLRYKDRHGRLCKAKLTQAQVLQRLREGKLSPRVEAARSPQGEYRPLGSHAEFRDVQPPARAAKAAPPAPRRNAFEAAWAAFHAHVPWWLALAAGIGLGIIALVGITAWQLSH